MCESIDLKTMEVLYLMIVLKAKYLKRGRVCTKNSNSLRSREEWLQLSFDICVKNVLRWAHNYVFLFFFLLQKSGIVVHEKSCTQIVSQKARMGEWMSEKKNNGMVKCKRSENRKAERRKKTVYLHFKQFNLIHIRDV